MVSSMGKHVAERILTGLGPTSWNGLDDRDRRSRPHICKSRGKEGRGHKVTGDLRIREMNEQNYPSHHFSSTVELGVDFTVDLISTPARVLEPQSYSSEETREEGRTLRVYKEKVQWPGGGGAVGSRLFAPKTSRFCPRLPLPRSPHGSRPSVELNTKCT